VPTLWGLVAPRLLIQGWLATVDLFIAALAFVRGRMGAPRAVGEVIGALISGAVYSACLRAGFWYLMEVEGLGRALREQVFFCAGAALSAALALRRGPVTAGKDLPPGRCHPGLAVPDLDVFHRRMMENGVRCLQEPRAVFGSRIAQYADPDGLAISIGEERRSS
jgi:hypothetical protein